jgi:hypothetical protein
MDLLSSETTMRHLTDLRYVEAASQIINYSSLMQMELEKAVSSAELEKNLRMFVEIYLSKIKDVELLI